MPKFFLLSLTAIGLMLGSCNNPKPKQNKSRDTLPKAITPDTTPKKADTSAKQSTPAVSQTILTLPVLDAMFYEAGFAKSLHTDLKLSYVQINKLRVAAHNSVTDLSEDGSADTTSAKTADERYQETIKAIIGDDKPQQLQQLVNDSYTKGVAGLAPTKPNFVPTDTRIVVNAPAFRMDVFQDGKLLKTYRVGIGYPEFPLPAGMRRADTIIFRPAWIPPDEPWVKGKFHAGRKVSADNELNPLGLIKIPIGMPSLIHGGKPLEKIGNFASHGCVGLTNAQVEDFTPLLAKLGGVDLTADTMKLLLKHKAQTHRLKLPNPVPIDLRYETIVAEGGSIHIYRDVYERGTNTLDNAKRILNIYGVNYDQLSEQEKNGLDSALTIMNRDARGNAIATDSIQPSKNGVAASKLKRAKKGKVTQRVKGQKEAVIPISLLQGKGYPDPVDLNDGTAGVKKVKHPVRHHHKKIKRRRR